MVVLPVACQHWGPSPPADQLVPRPATPESKHPVSWGPNRTHQQVGTSPRLSRGLRWAASGSDTTYQLAKTWCPARPWDHQATKPIVLEPVPPSSKAPPALRPLRPNNKLPQDPWAHNQPYVSAAPPTSGLAPTLEPPAPAVNLNRTWPQPSTGWHQFHDSPWLAAGCTRIQPCQTAVNSLHPRRGLAPTAIIGPTTAEALTQPM